MLGFPIYEHSMSLNLLKTDFFHQHCIFFSIQIMLDLYLSTKYFLSNYKCYILNFGIHMFIFSMQKYSKFLQVYLVFCDLAKITYQLQVHVCFLFFSLRKISANKGRFISFFNSVCIFFFCCISLDRTSSTLLNKNVRHPFLVSDLKGRKAFSHLPLLTVVVFASALCQDQEVLFYSNFLRF